ncbi:hypothetical protein C3Y87_04255 [Carbonactinospora thermoautotrophica]|uniref:Uncharacterized protein n=1 Tax=Carbonactinospora thermoautotrophica TaxID=1469144 RepID=A0A132MRJ4_9ACTN|nr:hypothetical protein [Carbonactinospora thermoautotrophica]KWX00414.1 hypothetical protein TH66_16630 [Carbonactinospora thermoautotrophica]KWX01512.1 hypothetical protein LI90_2544 [Carbonactinospora thermoautotrophica]KWX10637.1 hypothetical protein TR74_02445 [Carbonactinospora thermoautotrophica]MCX9190636.1 hypothetical protein [Carbonactinospora thermoautotrophica]
MLSSRRVGAMSNAATFDSAAYGAESRCWLLGSHRPRGESADQDEMTDGEVPGGASGWSTPPAAPGPR